MDAHGGQRPPDSLIVKSLKKVCRCFFSKEKTRDMAAIAKAQKETAQKMQRNQEKSKAQKKVAVTDGGGKKGK